MLITELGYFALISALVIAILQVILPAVGVCSNTNLLGNDWREVLPLRSFWQPARHFCA